jgi:hypothetical protein
MRPDANVTDAVGRIIAERDEATLEMNKEVDFVRKNGWRKKRDGLQRAFDIMVEEGVIVP